ncbi:hypothetical protein Tco_0746130 [Tanacetum coccineum]
MKANTDRPNEIKAGKVAKKRTLKRSQQLVDEFVDEGIPLTEPGFGDLEADTQRAIEESLKDAHGAPRGPLPPVVFRETDTGKFQPLPEVEGKGKEKVGVEQAAQVLLNLQTPKKKSPAEQYIFQRRTSAPTEPSGHDESSSLYVELGLTESDTESDEEMPPVVKSGDQDEGQARPDPGIQDKAATTKVLRFHLNQPPRRTQITYRGFGGCEPSPGGKIRQTWVQTVQVGNQDIPYQVSKACGGNVRMLLNGYEHTQGTLQRPVRS